MQMKSSVGSKEVESHPKPDLKDACALYARPSLR